MRPLSGNIARKIIITYSSLALVIVLVSIGSILAARYVHRAIIVEARRRQESVLLSARIRSEALLLANATQRYVIASDRGEVERQEINKQVTLLEELLKQAVQAVDPNDLDESIALGRVRELLVAFKVQSRYVLDTSDEEGGLGPETTRQMNILLNHYQPALIEALEAYAKFERDTAEEFVAQAEYYAVRLGVILIILSVASIALVVAMSFWLVRRFIVPLTALTENVSLLPDLSMNTLVDITSNDEMGALAQALNRMKTEINESRQKLEQYAATLESHVEERTRELRLLAIIDPLTGIYNRGHFFALAEQLFFESKRLNHPFSVALFDIDHFKTVNDQFGHAAGDYALKLATHAMQAQIRQMDVLGRYGGEEFVMALPTAGTDEAYQIGQRIVAAVREIQLEHEGHHFGITISAGIASYNYEDDGLESILLKADKALYMAKERGRDLVVAYKPTTTNKEKT